MVSKPSNRNQRIVPPSLYPELVESIAAFLKRADETFGVKVDYISLNEADGGFNLKFSATEQASLISSPGRSLRSSDCRTHPGGSLATPATPHAASAIARRSSLMQRPRRSW